VILVIQRKATPGAEMQQQQQHSSDDGDLTSVLWWFGEFG